MIVVNTVPTAVPEKRQFKKSIVADFILRFFSHPPCLILEPLCHTRTIIRDKYIRVCIYIKLFREGKDSWRESRLKCIESSLIACLYLWLVAEEERSEEKIRRSLGS